MDPVTISALIAGGSSIVSLIEKLVASRNEDAAAAQADLIAEVDKMKAMLDPGGAVDQAFAADDAKLDAAIAKAEEEEKAKASTP